MKYYPVTVVDNFFKDPDSIRKLALAQKFLLNSEVPDPEKELYPGSRTDEIPLLDREIYDTLCTQVFSIFHNFAFEKVNWNVISFFQLVSNNWNNGWIHVDNDTVFAGVVYLTPDAPLDSGTSIYKTNNKFDSVRYNELQKSKQLFYRKQISGEEYFKDKQECNSMFDETVKVNNVYNRLVMFDGEVYHSANEFFGDNSNDSRLTIAFFVQKLEMNSPSTPPLVRLR
jgi:hypothetical protein